MTGVRLSTWIILLIQWVSPCRTFLPNFWSRVLTLSLDSHTHQYMTEQAVINVTLETLYTMPDQQQDFGDQEKADLGRAFWRAVAEVVDANVAMDFLSSTRSDPVYHFDSERVQESIQMLRDFWKQTVLLTKNKDYLGARYNLGRLFHALQDFYSHSNWVEMGQKSEYLHLLHPSSAAIPVASEDTPTCAACYRYSCYNNLLEEFVTGPQESLLTTGYFGSYPVKPAGKCSHGGVLDFSRHQAAEGGINKDSTSPIFSPHHYLHNEAAQLATKATVGVLHDLRHDVGPKSFLRLFSVQQPPALVFVIDTTGSMFEEITAARLRALSIIRARKKSRAGGLPGTFLLVPFHDPDVGPVMETDDPGEFQVFMENLMALGGGDEPEMCISAVQLALIHSPPLSEIFVFTDASPKDAHLYGAVRALIQDTQSKVNFLLTEDPSHEARRRRRRSPRPHRFSLYSSLSSLSGGMTIFTTNKDIHRASAIVEDSATSSKVTLFHAESDADSSQSFNVDQAVRSVRLQVAGKLTQCVLVNPTGASQSLLTEAGPLAETDQLDGLYRARLLPPIEPGQWHVNVKARGPITFNVLGESSLDFLYFFAVEANETHPGLRRLEGSPIAGVSVFLVVVITGLSVHGEASFSHVTLRGTNGERHRQILLNSTSGSGEELVAYIESVPRMPFSVHLCGRDGRGNKLERVSAEIIQPTRVHVQVRSAPHLLAGRQSAVVFEVFNHGPARRFTLTAVDDQRYLVGHKQQTLSMGERSSERGEVNLFTPHSTPAGQSLTLTLTIQADDSPDANYAVVHLSVSSEEPDMSPPSCSSMRVELTCRPQCSLGKWGVSLSVKDQGHSGLAGIQLTVGTGTLTMLAEEGPTEHQLHDRSVNISEWARGRTLMLRYTSDCCDHQAELLVWDKAGNTRRCHLTASQQRALRERSRAANNITPARLNLALWGVLALGMFSSICT